jgi:hypothetical protein
MGDFDPDFIQTLATQSWSLYGVGMFLILLRLWEHVLPHICSMADRKIDILESTDWASETYKRMTILWLLQE